MTAILQHIAKILAVSDVVVFRQAVAESIHLSSAWILLNLLLGHLLLRGLLDLLTA